MNDRVERDLRISELALKLVLMFEDWSVDMAMHCATRIVTTGEQCAFQLDVERDLDSLPMTKEAA